MYTYTLRKLPKSSVEILAKIPKATIAEEYGKAFGKLQGLVEIEGFRKGKAPKAIAEKHIKKEMVYEELIRNLLPKIYDEILKKENLKPIVNPRVDLVSAKENEDWEVKITVAEKPAISLGNYKELIQKLKEEEKKKDIWVPGKAQPEKDQKQEAENRQNLLNHILDALLKSTTFELADMVVEDEVNRRLSNLVNDIQKIGLTVESYLKSKNLTQEQLRKTYEKEILDTYKLEFILGELADIEQIKVENQDIEKLLASITDPKERESAKKNAYFYATLLRKQKTLDRLLTL